MLIYLNYWYQYALQVFYRIHTHIYVSKKVNNQKTSKLDKSIVSTRRITEFF